MTAALRLIPALPRGAWLLLGGDALSALGAGLTLPFFVVYLHSVRGIDLDLAGLALATVAAAGLAGNPLGGALSDRFGPRRTLAAGLLLTALGTASIAVVRDWRQAFASAALFGLGGAIAWPAQDALLATLVTPEQRSAAFSVRHATLNAGLGAGALLGALAADVSSAGGFQLLYLLDAGSTLLFIPLVLCAPGLRAEAEARVDAPGGGYRAVLGDRLFRRLLLVTATLVTAGYAQYHATLPAFATGPGELSPHALGIVFAANTFTVVAVQLVVLRMLAGHRRTRGLMLAGGFWAASWTVTLAAGSLDGGVAGLAGFTAAMVLFAIGETLLSPTLPALVNDLAPARLRGRYNGAYATSWSSGYVVGPAIGGVMLGAGMGNALLIGMGAACGLAAVAAVRLERRLPASANLVPPPGKRRPASAGLSPIALESAA